MMHDYHQGLPGYHDDQLLHDGCGECERRSKDIRTAIGNLDSSNFARAWVRAAELQTRGLDNVSNAELPILHALIAVEIQFERFGIPLGKMPVVLH